MKLYYIFTLYTFLIIVSCSSKKDILYSQDIDQIDATALRFETSKIQANDILKITVNALEPSTAIPYNKVISRVNTVSNLQILRLEGYEVSETLTIQFPQLGAISVKNQTTSQLAAAIKTQLQLEGHLIKPVVNVRILNAKFTILGEVARPGTYSFTETKLRLFQAIGMAGDLTILGKRKNIKLIREIDQKRSITYIDLTKSDWMNSNSYYIYPNDIIIIDPNNTKVKSAGLVGNVGTVLTLASVLLSSIVLLTR